MLTLLLLVMRPELAQFYPIIMLALVEMFTEYGVIHNLVRSR